MFFLSFLAFVTVVSATVDSRNLTSGSIIANITSGYSDQPNCLIRHDAAWLCTVTYNNLPEGSAGERVITSISKDKGKTWTPRQPIEPGQTLQHAYSTLFQGKGNQIFVIYIENSDNVTSLNGADAKRRDMFGHFWLRRSIDGGLTWGNKTERWEVPVRETTIDRENSWHGKTRIQWLVDKGFTTQSGGAYVAFAKVGTYVVNPPTSSWMLHSSNLLQVDHPSEITWELLPKGDEGIHNWSPESPGISEEPHAVPMSSSLMSESSNQDDMYMVFRTTEGTLGARVSRDGGETFELVEGSTGTTLEMTAQYWDENGKWKTSKSLKHPRGPSTPRNIQSLGGDTEYVLLYYNNGNKGFSNRNPYWIVPGWTVADNMNRTSIQWGQPEIALYAVNSARGPGYPDFIVDDVNKQLYITETEKIYARLHEISKDLLKGLLNQRIIVQDVTMACENEKDVLLRLSSPLPKGDIRNLTTTDSSSSSSSLILSNSFSILTQFTGALSRGNNGEPSVLFSNVRTNANGVQTGVRLVQGLVQETIILEVGRLSSAHLNIPYRFILDATCAKQLVEDNVSHFFAVSVDKGPAVITVMVDGVLCDGGVDQVQGWIEMPRGVDDPLLFVDGWMSAKVAGVVGPSNVELEKVVVMNRYLRTTEMLGTYRAWKETRV